MTMLKVYVDDGRQINSKMKKGHRYDTEKEKFVWTREAQEEDERLERNGEKKDTYMARICLPLMNNISKDLTLTA